MQKWLLKALVQKSISFLPQAHKVNYQIQKLTTLRQGMPDHFFLDRLRHFTQHYRFFKQYNLGSFTDYSLLELGTGWHPIVPLGFYLSGANNILTIDIRKLISAHSLNQTLQKFRQFYQRGELVHYIPDLNIHRMQRLLELTENQIKTNPYELLPQLNITAREADARHLELPDHHLDIVISNNVLQDIPPFILEAICQEFVRLLKPGGLMSHAIDFADQYATFDEQISPLNYLQFSEKQWYLVTNKLVRQNRKRISYYRQLFKNVNLTVLDEVNTTGKKQVLESIKLHPQFQHIPEEELLILHSHIVGRL
jgi:SAM-dependent methyltransferase